MTITKYSKQAKCIRVNAFDEANKLMGKSLSHKITGSEKTAPLHRAFSVFLYDLNGRMLVQKRSKSKETFPSIMSNACCSHYLGHRDTPKNESFYTKMKQLKRYAKFKLHHELGLRYDSFLKFQGILKYSSNSSATFGESESTSFDNRKSIIFL